MEVHHFNKREKVTKKKIEDLRIQGHHVSLTVAAFTSIAMDHFNSHNIARVKQSLAISAACVLDLGAS